MRTLSRWEPFGRTTSLEDQVNRLFKDVFERNTEQSSLTTWAPSVDIYESEHELVVKADLPEVDPQDLDIRVENNILTIRGERKFEKTVNESNYLRVERSYGTFARSFSLSNTVKSEAIKADYQNGVLKLSIPKPRSLKLRAILNEYFIGIRPASAPYLPQISAVKFGTLKLHPRKVCFSQFGAN